MNAKIKLSDKQKQVIKDVQNGYIIITGNEMKGAIIGRNIGEQYCINNGVFWRLVDKGLIAQGDAREQFNYRLTDFGKKIKL